MNKLYYDSSRGSSKKLTSCAQLLSKRLSFLAMMIVFLTSIGNYSAQTVNQYTFAASTGTFTPLVGGTNVAAVQADDAVSTAIALPFTFNYGGVNYTSLIASSNGFLSFNPTSTNSAANNLSTNTTSRPLVAPLWDDLNGAGTGTASYLTTGAPGSQVFTFEWLNWKWNWGATAAVISFQVKLYEGTNVVEFIYQQEAAAINGTGSASIGLAGSATGVYLSLNNSTGTPVASNSVNTTNIATKPATGQIYTFTPPPACTGTPTAGTVNAPSNACSGQNFTTSLTGATSGVSGLTYQWQSSADNITFTNIGGATNATLTTANQTAATYYQCIVTCTNSSSSSTTPAVLVGMNSFLNCYLSSGATSTADEDILNVTLGTLNNSSVCTSTGYSDFTSTVPAPNLVLGSSVPFSVNFGTCGGNFDNIGKIWIDFNQNGSFLDAGELVFTSPMVNGAHIETGSITIPLTANIGNTRMRVIQNETTNTAFGPSGTYSWGETEDYLVNIACPTLTSPTGTNEAICSGATANLTASTTNGSINWYDALTGGNLLATTNSYTTPVLTATTTYYAETVFTGCPSPTRTAIIANVSPVAVTIATQATTCNGTADGTFTITSVQCGTAPFEYNIDANGYVATIPTDLTSGTHTLMIKDVNGLESPIITLDILAPSAPVNANAYNTNIYSADVTWTPQGTETEWTVIYGPAGFDPSTSGTTIVATNDSINIPNLTANTDYEFYVAANCAMIGDYAGPIAFSTDGSFYTWDGNCGPGYQDISTTGTPLNTTDDSEFGMVFPFPFVYQGITLNDITIGNNGGIIFGTQTGNVDYSISGTSPNTNAIFPFIQDLATPANSSGNLYTEVVGIAPNRKFIVQWHNIMSWPTTPSTASFQVVFEETSNEIYFLYDDVDFGNSADDNGADAEIGVKGATNINVSMNSTSYLSNNSCIHFYDSYCPNPTNLTSMIYQEEIQLDWTAGLYNETNWTLIYGPTGFDPATSGTTLSLTTSDATIPGLTQLTDYDFYIYSECQADNLTSPGLKVTLQTLPWCNNPTSLAGSTTGLDMDSVNVSWSWTAVSGAVNGLTGFNVQYGPTGFLPGNGTIVAANGVNFADTITDQAFMAGSLYQGYVQAVCGTDSSNFVGPFDFIMPLSNDTVCGAEMLQVDGTVYNFDNTGATVSTGEGTIAPPTTDYEQNDGWGDGVIYNSVWFKFIAPASGNMRIDMTNVSADVKAAVYGVTTCNTFNSTNFDFISGNENFGPSNFTSCGLIPGNEYYLLVSGIDSWWSGTYEGLYSIKMTPINLNAGTPTSVINACLKDTVNLFTTITGQQPNGTWSWVTPTAGLTDSLFNTNGSASQIFDFEYRLTDGCAYDTVIGQVRVYPASSAGMDGQIDVCRNQPVNLLSGLSGNIDLGGSWINPSNQTLASGQINASNIPGQFNYQYITGNGICPNDTAEVLVNVLSNCNYLDLEELVFENLTIYPNPTNGLVNIANSNAADIFNLEVTDLGGRVILSKEAAINGANNQIDLSGNETGIYLIKVFNANAEKVYRIVLQ